MMINILLCLITAPLNKVFVWASVCFCYCLIWYLSPVGPVSDSHYLHLYVRPCNYPSLPYYANHDQKSTNESRCKRCSEICLVNSANCNCIVLLFLFYSQYLPSWVEVDGFIIVDVDSELRLALCCTIGSCWKNGCSNDLYLLMANSIQFEEYWKYNYTVNVT